jgi:hypothetical protein
LSDFVELLTLGGELTLVAFEESTVGFAASASYIQQHEDRETGASRLPAAYCHPSLLAVTGGLHVHDYRLLVCKPKSGSKRRQKLCVYL